MPALTDAPYPGRDCPICPRLVAFRQRNREAEPGWHNAPVPSFGPQGAPQSARLLVVGLAPGLKGANRTGRPFTGDYAGDLLYATLGKFGFAEGEYGRSPDDGFRLIDCRITNAVRCVPPENKPTPAEIAGLPPLPCRRDRVPAPPRGRARPRRHRPWQPAGRARRAPARAAPSSMARCTSSTAGSSSPTAIIAPATTRIPGRLTVAMFESVIAALRERLG